MKKKTIREPLMHEIAPLVKTKPTYPEHPGVPGLNLEAISIQDLVNTNLFRHHARCVIITMLHKRDEAAKLGRLKRHPIDALLENQIIGYNNENEIDNFCKAFIMWYDKTINLPRAQRDMIQVLGMDAYNDTCSDIARYMAAKKMEDEKKGDKRSRKGRK